jgi:hypothetical protein
MRVKHSRLLEQADFFECLRREIVYHNDRDVGRFVTAVRRYAKLALAENTARFWRSAHLLTSDTFRPNGDRPRLAGHHHGMRPALPGRHRVACVMEVP